MQSNINPLKFLFEPLRTLGHADISSTYAAIGNPLGDPCIWAYFYNATDVDIIFSIGGDFDGPLLPSQGWLVIDAQTNRSATQQNKVIADNAQIYVRAPNGDPSLGNVYVTTGF